ncbi:lipopolysaccharide biosynthesis protein [Photobacterium iliopiscarium]|uniref:Polysaccharide biosynthesis protein C-terminal domain-containing protein n=1 Tax=Photobacterium iliopiscarium TaxID=56192 RepID=A0A2T3MP53_9GAMM|nr:hypothetical protein [Photobacterium iliopiscarium]PSV98598.1 hypothetical protein C9I88_03985 [Photobacterium iliopiscarium]
MNKQIIRNVFFNGLSFICNFLVTLLLVPYLVDSLGIVAYGFIPLSMIFTAYIGVITETLTTSITRQITTALHNNDIDKVIRVFNTSLTLMIMIIIFLFIILNFSIGSIDGLIDIPIGFEGNVEFLFYIIIVNFLLSLITANFSVSMYACNRMDYMQINTAFRVVIRCLLIYLLFNYDQASLPNVAIATLGSGILSLLYALYFFRKLTPEIKINLLAFDKNEVKGICVIGGWLLINQLGFILFSKVDLLIVNKMLGIESSSLYSLAIQFSDLLKIFAGVIGGVLGPVTMILYSTGKTKEMRDITFVFSKLMSLTCSILIILICFYSDSIIRLWIGDEYININGLVWAVTIPLIISVGVYPLFSVNVAMNKVNIPALLNLILGAIGILVAIVLIENTELGYYAVAISTGSMLVIKNLIFIPIYTANIMKIRVITFINIHLVTIVFSILSFAFLFLIKEFFSYHINGYVSLFCVLISSGLLLLLLSLFFYTKSEIKSILDFFKNK